MTGSARSSPLALAGLILVAVGAAAFVGWRVYVAVRPASPAGAAARPAGGARNAAPVAVETAPVTRATLRDAIVFSGALEPRSRLVVATKVAGRLERILVRVGERVRRGDELQPCETARADPAAQRLDNGIGRRNLLQHELLLRSLRVPLLKNLLRVK